VKKAQKAFNIEAGARYIYHYAVKSLKTKDIRRLSYLRHGVNIHTGVPSKN
jgi:hypothetical protein